MKALIAMFLVAILAVAAAQQTTPVDPTVPAPTVPTTPPNPTDPPPVNPTDPVNPSDPVPPADPVPTPVPPTDPVPTPVQPTPPAPKPVTPPAPKPVTPAPKPVAPPPRPTDPVPTPKPVAPPAQKPVVGQPLELKLETTEPEIRNGAIRDVLIVRTFKMPSKSVTLSRKNGKPSVGLENAMQAAWRSLRRNSENATWIYEKSSKSWVAVQQSAWRINEQQSRAFVLEAIKYNKTSARIVVQRSAPSRNVQDWYNKGIRYHFGGGESFFRGSSDFRVTNIIAGARQIDNTYIAAGATFDFNRDVKISKELGFVDGYIIKGGILEKDIGGGICQVSTTVWRAAYNAGLPITQRNYHSYRVVYYDPPGFEATVFSPYKNMKFRNDTEAPLFIQVTWYLRSQKLEMQFFGAKPDRRVSISRGYISNVRPPPATRFIADPTIRLGRAKRLSGAERGMNVSIYRTVRYNSGRVAKDTTFSSYVPWGELWAVNPNDSRIRANVRVPNASVLPSTTIATSSPVLNPALIVTSSLPAFVPPVTRTTAAKPNEQR